MKLVYRVDTSTLKVVKVPETYVECSVCGHWKPFEDYCREPGVMCRTNCKACYEMPWEGMKQLSIQTETDKEKNKYAIARLEDDVEKRRYCVTKREFMENMAKQLANVGDDELIYPYYETHDGDGYRTTEPMNDLSFVTERGTLLLDEETPYVRVEIC